MPIIGALESGCIDVLITDRESAEAALVYEVNMENP
jgi:DNA-binding transcriptional regulator LsrR (DeoR family)